jgi:pseudouridine kinase
VLPVTVIGSIVMDYKWYPVGRLLRRHADYPLWQVQCRHGGVGRNVAENLALLGLPVVFAGLSGVDDLAERMEGQLRAAGVRLAVVRTAGGVGRFDVHLDNAGQLERSRIRLPPEELLTWEALGAVLPELGSTSIVVVETGLAAPMIGTLRDYTHQLGIRLLGMPTRLRDLGPRWPLVRRMDILVLNEIEAAAMTELRGGGLSVARAQVRKILAGGPSMVVLTCGSRGVVAASLEEPEPRHFPARLVSCVDDTGAGDALTAALVAALVNASDLTTAVGLGLEAAGVTVACPYSACRKIRDLAKSADFS